MRYFEQLQERFPGVEYYPLAKIMKKCLVNNPSERFTARELLSSLKSMVILIVMGGRGHNFICPCQL